MMVSEHEKRLNELLGQVFDLPREQRHAFLVEACGDSEELLQEALAFLDHEAKIDGFLEDPAVGALAGSNGSADEDSPGAKSVLGGLTSVLDAKPWNDQSAVSKPPDSPLDETRVQNHAAGPEVVSLDPGSHLGGYTVINQLGAGGMGEVYRARDNELHREVALKILQPALTSDAAALNRFRREARLLASVNHPNIATIHGFDESQGIRFLVMELVEGRSLAEELHEGALPTRRGLELNRDIANALEAAHRRGIVHRDLKPANVMVGREGWVKVLDFGLAKALGVVTTADIDASMITSPSLLLTPDETITAGLLGTVPYLSPEQIRHQQADQRSDIWAFGCVLFETLTCRRPFRGNTRIETICAILEQDPPWRLLPPDVPDDVSALIAYCLEKDPERRMQSIGDARATLEEVLNAMSTVVSITRRSGAHRLSSFRAAASRPASGSGTFRPGPASASAEALGLSPSTLNYLDSLSHYTVVEKIGVGGHGELYRAWDRQQERDVALKVLRPELLEDEDARQALRQEAQALTRFRHPNIANLYDVGTVGGIDYLVMEYIDGTPLGVRIAEGRLPMGVVLELGAQMAEALASAHEHGILHRDLKTDNVLVTPDGRAKLIDFSLSRATDERGAPKVGPLAYCPPEFIAHGTFDHRGDIYALGVILYTMITGRKPFEGRDPEALSSVILDGAPKPPSTFRQTVDLTLERLVLRCLAKDPEERFDSARELADALEDLAPATAVTEFVEPVTKTRALDGTLQDVAAANPRQRWLFGGVFVVLVLLIGAMATLQWRPGNRDGAVPSVENTNPLTQIQSVVVMPSELSNAEDTPFLADALAQALTGALTRVDGLEVKLPPSSFDIERRGAELTEVAKAYGADAMVVPSAVLDGDRLDLEIRLVNVSSRSILWDATVQGNARAYTDVARSAAGELRQALRPTVESAALAAVAPVDPEVRRLIDQGRYYANRYINSGDESAKDRALENFENAYGYEPPSAEAAGEIAALYISSLDLDSTPLEVQSEIRTWAERALLIDPKNSKALMALAYLEGGRTPQSYHRKLMSLLQAAKYSEDSDGDAHIRLSRPLGASSFRLSLAAVRQGSKANPLVQVGPIFEAICLGALGQVAEGLARLDEVLDIEPDLALAWWTKSVLLSLGDRGTEAFDIVEQRLEAMANGGKLHRAWVNLARDFALLVLAKDQDDADLAEEVVQRMIYAARGEDPFYRWESATTDVAGHLARFGRTEEALELLLFRSEQGIYLPYDYLLFNPTLEPIRDDPRFQEVLALSRSRFRRMGSILEEARAQEVLPQYLEKPIDDLLLQIREAQKRTESSSEDQGP